MTGRIAAFPVCGDFLEKNLEPRRYFRYNKVIVSREKDTRSMLRREEACV